MADEETLVSRRSRRSTAGNRMELALAELALDEPQGPEEDVEFVVEKEEEDVFESDFASTDEEAAVQEDADEGDRGTREEERRERKIARTRVEKATAAAHSRQRVTFDPEAAFSQSRPKPSKPKRRVSLGVVVNAETGEVIEGSTGTVGGQRHSQRRHTVMNTSATVNRMKDAEEKRAAIPKKTKIASRLPTQDELIARALDTEEGNIIEHRDYLRLEEEKRAKARVVKKSIDGPVLRWISKKEIVQTEIQHPPPPPPSTSANMYTSNFSFVYTPGVTPTAVGSQAYSMPFYAYTPPVAQNLVSKPQESTPSTTASSDPSGTPATSSNPATSTVSTLPSVPPWQQQLLAPQTQFQAQSQFSTQPNFPAGYFYTTTPAAPFIVHRKEDVCKNYVIHELSQTIPINPPWKDTMAAMFGDHVAWDEVKVFTGKGRPLARPVRMCSITGQPAKYLDPKTNAPFADVGAYGILTKLLGRDYVWSSALGCYVGTVSETSPRDKEKVSGKDADHCESASATVGGQEDDGIEDVGEAEMEEPTTKRRRVGIIADEHV